MRCAFLILFFSFSLLYPEIPLHAQTKQQQEVLLNLSERHSKRFEAERAFAVRLADSLGIIVRKELEDGQVMELMRFRDGRPMYYITHNAEGAAAINADRVYLGGGGGFNLTGAGQTLGIWDGGKVRNTHQEFMTATGSRVVQRDNAGFFSSHATHVAGTLMGAGINKAARGMSWEARLDAYDWNDDNAQMAAAAAEGLQVSQHSYGYATGWQFNSSSNHWYWHGDPSVSETEDYFFGFYDDHAMEWDEIAYHAPHYLIVKSAGNERGRGPEPGTTHYVNMDGSWVSSDVVRDVDGGEDGYKSLSHAAVAKNIISVGAVYPNGSMTHFSAWGPTDDGRIKPDLVAKGRYVFSSVAAADDAYATYSGTSMSGPMVSGSVGLLLEYQQKLFPGEVLMAATIKALLLHTADDLIGGAPGPDYRYGWGMLDVQGAATIMRNNQSSGQIHMYEKTLQEGEEISLQLRATGEEPLKATIVWTDKPGTPVDPPVLNPADLMLVNDLDMRIINALDSVYKPYVLDPGQPEMAAATGDNFRDNVEVVYIASPGTDELFTLTINHKGTLEGGEQPFSLIISGNMGLDGVANPQNLVAHPLGTDEVDVQWEPNNDNDGVMLVWSPDNSFGIPEEGVDYQAGDLLPGGGTVLYRGENTGFIHSGLKEATTYYYQVFSVDQSIRYSMGSRAYAMTSCDKIALFPFTEDFDGSIQSPVCWEVLDHEGNGQVWKFGGHDRGLAGTTGFYAYVNSDLFGPGNKQHTDLISPLLDFSGHTHVTLSFTHFFRQYEDWSVASLFYSLDDGVSWELINEWRESTQNPAFFRKHFPDLAGESQVRFRWNFQGEWAYYWNVDDVGITAICETTPFAGGDGSKEDPWRIEDAVHLNNVRKYTGEAHGDRYFIQTAAICLGHAPWDRAGGWEPIGSPDQAFYGSFDGDGHSISQLSIVQPGKTGVGLFGVADGARLQQLNIVDAHILGGARTAVLVGLLENNGLIRDTHVSGKVSGEGSGHGGLVGMLKNNSAVSFSSSRVNLTHAGPQHAGGLAGLAEGSSISNSFATGLVSGRYVVGGLAGELSANGSIHNAYAAGDVEGVNTVGGLLGRLWPGTVSNSFSAGKVEASQDQKGGLLAEKAPEGAAVISSYWNTVTSGLDSSAGGEPKTSEEMMRAATFEGWDFVNAWAIEQGSSYPYLQWQGEPGAFSYPPFILQAVVVPDGAGFVEGAGLFQAESEVAVHAYPAPGNYFVHWKDADGKILGEKHTYKLTMPTDNVALFAHFAPYEASDEMILVFNTELGNGRTITLPLTGTVSVTIDWGDGQVERVTTSGNKTHTYDEEGIYEVRIGGRLQGFEETAWRGFDNAEKLIRVISFGDLGLTNLRGAFNGASNLTEVPPQLPEGVTNISYMFMGASSFNQHIGGWDVSGVTNMMQMFRDASSFNQDIGNWDVSRVLFMDYMFRGAAAFNQDIGGWEVGRVRNMRNMFTLASAFNQDIGGWDTGNVLEMRAMFQGASSFNQDISQWDVGNINNMSAMFQAAIQFDQDIGSWDVGSVVNMDNMFQGVTLSTANYNSLLIGWAGQSQRDNVSFHGGDSRYSAGKAAEAREAIITNHGWTITDGGVSDQPGYVLTLKAEPAHEVILFGAGQYEEGHHVQLGVAEDTSVGFLRWQDQEEQLISEEAEVVYVMPARDVTLIALFEPSTLVDTPELSQLRVFPNPFGEVIVIDHAEEVSSVTITNLHGQVVKQLRPESSSQIVIRTDHLPASAYLMIIEGRSGFREVRKMLKR